MQRENPLKILFNDWNNVEQALKDSGDSSEAFIQNYENFKIHFENICNSKDYANYYSVYFTLENNYFAEYIETVKKGILENDYSMIRCAVMEFEYASSSRTAMTSLSYFSIILILFIVIFLIFIFLFFILQKYEKQIEKFNQLDLYAAYVIKQIDEERHRISKDLHDSILQDLKVLELEIENLSLPHKYDLQKEKLILDVNSSIKKLRNICQNLVPRELKNVNDANGLINSIKNLCEDFEKQNKISCKFAIQNEIMLKQVSLQQSLNIFWIIQEALNNIQNHAKAESVSVVVKNPSEKDEKLVIYITDDGTGFDVEKSKKDKHFGLQNMHDRAKIIGAELFIQSDSDTGTEIKLVF